MRTTPPNRHPEPGTGPAALEDRALAITLRTLATAEGPLGARTLLPALRAGGIDWAEATAGRYLRQLDEVGLTQSLGKRGRVITRAGRRRLRDLDMRTKLAAQGARVAEVVRSHDLDDLIDLLYARRAIEVEAARLAAERATAAELAAIAAAADDHVDCVQSHERVGRAHDFHLLVAAASHNRMLAAMAEMFLDPANDLLAELLDLIADDAGAVAPMANDHARLAAALAARDGEAAKRLMQSHLDHLIRLAEAHRDTRRRPRTLRTPRPRR
ncbi:MAG: FCD domain-containing protein [Geminicoccaceae bacterium]|nr:MAG: FCD domain-containing protein [Geminicoccaceae bacterium]